MNKLDVVTTWTIIGTKELYWASSDLNLIWGTRDKKWSRLGTDKTNFLHYGDNWNRVLDRVRYHGMGGGAVKSK